MCVNQEFLGGDYIGPIGELTLPFSVKIVWISDKCSEREVKSISLLQSKCI